MGVGVRVAVLTTEFGGVGVQLTGIRPPLKQPPLVFVGPGVKGVAVGVKDGTLVAKGVAVTVACPHGA